jgi:hypothetical protein
MFHGCGVPIQTWQLPTELWEPHNGPPITEDDLIDFHNFIEEHL